MKKSVITELETLDLLDEEQEQNVSDSDDELDDERETDI